MARLIEYISREEVCRFCNNKKEYCGKEKCPVYKAPTVDAVEVVRCRDCSHVFICNCQSCRQGVSVYCEIYGKHMTMNDFCSYGERRDTDVR